MLACSTLRQVQYNSINYWWPMSRNLHVVLVVMHMGRNGNTCPGGRGICVSREDHEACSWVAGSRSPGCFACLSIKSGSWFSAFWGGMQASSEGDGGGILANFTSGCVSSNRALITTQGAPLWCCSPAQGPYTQDVVQLCAPDWG